MASRFSPPATPLLNGERHNFTTKTWRSGAAPPYRCDYAKGVVVAGKLFVVTNGRMLPVYDPQSNAWNGRLRILPIYDNHGVTSVCAHNGRLVVFLSDGTALELADGSWSEDYEVAVAGGCGHDDIVESVILG